MKLLITNIVNYKDKDGIIAGFNESGNFSILAKGILNPKSKNACINNPMTIADIELAEPSKAKHDVLKSSELIFSPLELFGSISLLAMVMLLNEIIVKCLNDEEKTLMYKDIVTFLKKLKKGKDIRFRMLSLIAKMLNLTGYQFDVDECTACGSRKDIVGFSMEDGGFICKECIKNMKDTAYTKEELVWLRRIFKIDLKDKLVIEEDISKQSFAKILKTMIIFIQDNYGLQLKNTELILD